MYKKILILSVIIIVAILGFWSMNDEDKKTINDSQIILDEKKEVKEFSMTSFVEFVDEKPKPQFSLKEIFVNKGDLVRIKITVTKGAHDFKIDEFNVYADTQLDKESVVEFVADKSGEFVYYCTKPGHRDLGHWGTLKVI